MVMDVISEAVLAAAPNFLSSGVDSFLPKPLPNTPMPTPTHPIFGHLPEVFPHFHRLYDWQFDQTIKLQKDPNYVGCWQTPIPINQPHFIVTCPKLLQYVMDNAESHPCIVQRDANNFEILSASFGRTSIFLIGGDTWQFRRKYYSHLFSLRSLREVMLPQFEINAHKIKARIDRCITSGKPFDAQDMFARATLDAISQVAFGQDMGCLDQEETPEFMIHFDASQEISFKRALDPMWRIKRFFQVSYEKDFVHSMDVVNKQIMKMIDDRAKGLYKSKNYTVLDVFEQKAKKDGHKMTPQMLRDITWDFLVAGRDTTACAATWLMYFFCTRPDIVAKVREELEGKDTSKFSTLLHELPYLTAVCMESQRLRPSVPNDNRGAGKTFTLPNGVIVPKGTPIIFSPYTFGRNPLIWGEDAMEFKPERWLNEEGGVRSFPESSFPHFNGGPRLCLGKTMALLELKSMISHLLSSYDFELVADADKVTYKLGIMLWVDGGLWLRAHTRTPTSAPAAKAEEGEASASESDSDEQFDAFQAAPAGPLAEALK